MSSVIACHPDKPEDSVLDQVAEVLIAGGTVILPTETQYGLTIRADREGTLERICGLKKRDSGHKPALFVKNMNMAERFCIINLDARKLANCFLPGPLTLVLPPARNQTVVSPDYLSSDGFGIRISSAPIMEGVYRRITFPLSATSANISGRETPSSVKELEKIFGDRVDLYVDGGNCPSTVSSTVVKVNGGLAILRRGQIEEKSIFECLERDGQDE